VRGIIGKVTSKAEEPQPEARRAESGGDVLGEGTGSPLPNS